MKIILLLLVFVSFNVNAAIIVYDGEGKKQDVDYVEKQGFKIPPLGELKESDLKKMTKRDLVDYMKQEPDSHKPIEQQKITGLGTVIYFVDLDSLSEDIAEVMNEVDELTEVRTMFFLKRPKAMMGYMLVPVKTNNKIKVTLKEDSNNKNARRLHVDSYPQIVYVMPGGEMARYSGARGGLTALKMRIGELKTLQELQEQERKERERINKSLGL